MENLTRINLTDNADIRVVDNNFTKVKNAIDDVESNITENSQDISDLQTDKQDKLTAGTNITIDNNNVISATGGGGSATIYRYGLRIVVPIEDSTGSYEIYINIDSSVYVNVAALEIRTIEDFLYFIGTILPNLNQGQQYYFSPSMVIYRSNGSSSSPELGVARCVMFEVQNDYYDYPLLTIGIQHNNDYIAKDYHNKTASESITVNVTVYEI